MLKEIHKTPWYRLEKLLPRERFGQLVLLGFDITAFTPVAYQRHRL